AEARTHVEPGRIEVSFVNSDLAYSRGHLDRSESASGVERPHGTTTDHLANTSPIIPRGPSTSLRSARDDTVFERPNDSTAEPLVLTIQPTASLLPIAENPRVETNATAHVLAQPVSVANIDTAVPESPAFAALGTSPETVTRPTSPRDFAASLL